MIDIERLNRTKIQIDTLIAIAEQLKGIADVMDKGTLHVEANVTNHY